MNGGTRSRIRSRCRIDLRRDPSSPRSSPTEATHHRGSRRPSAENLFPARPEKRSSDASQRHAEGGAPCALPPPCRERFFPGCAWNHTPGSRALRLRANPSVQLQRLQRIEEAALGLGNWCCTGATSDPVARRCPTGASSQLLIHPPPPVAIPGDCFTSVLQPYDSLESFAPSRAHRSRALDVQTVHAGPAAITLVIVSA